MKVSTKNAAQSPLATLSRTASGTHTISLRCVEVKGTRHSISTEVAVPHIHRVPTVSAPVNCGALGKTIWRLYDAVQYVELPSRASREHIEGSGEQA